MPLGHIGQISFWAPNRGLLITAGNEAVPAGLYYYNGVAWSELSTVCGGADGRIAWAGPDEFWTVSDQQTGQQLGRTSGGRELQDRSLCHFLNGRVVASYAEPIGVPGSYEPMDAAACAGSADCWFGGEVLPGSLNTGAFHLHWNGSALSALPSLETLEPQLEDPAVAVSDIAFFENRLYESAGGEIHRVIEGSSKPFTPLILQGPGGEALASPGGTVRFANAGGLWAVSADGTVLRLTGANQFREQALAAPLGEVADVAGEPGSGAIWASLAAAGLAPAQAQVVRLHGDGTLDPVERVPAASEGLGPKGSAGPIACPAASDCWMATSEGWLFHLGADQPRDEDPNFQSLITYRPPDASLPFVAPDEAPPDDSGANPASIPPQPTTPQTETGGPMVRAPLFSDVKTKLKGTTLALSFTLATKSHVRLLALRRRRTVAATGQLVLARGRRTLRLRLRRRAWPTKLSLQVHAIGPVPLIPSGGGAGGGGPTGGPTTVGTSLRAPGAGPLSSAPSLRLP
ncbi:MAG TPA: hypothetical protein VGI24_04780 [Solirubrobacteraceae bacterium]